jgi:hypothetical protein
MYENERLITECICEKTIGLGTFPETLEGLCISINSDKTSTRYDPLKHRSRMTTPTKRRIDDDHPFLKVQLIYRFLKQYSNMSRFIHTISFNPQT